MQYRVICSETLFYEMMTTDRSSLMRCFSKFPDRAGSFLLVPNVGSLLRYEMEHQEACVPLVGRAIEGEYAFNRKLGTGLFNLEAEAETHIAR
jgi:hypothetical protein